MKRNFCRARSPERLFVVGDELFLFFFRLAPVAARADKVGLDAALGARADDLALELLLLAPLADAVQAAG